jgi:hypothetical protein
MAGDVKEGASLALLRSEISVIMANGPKLIVIENSFTKTSVQSHVLSFRR